MVSLEYAVSPSRYARQYDRLLDFHPFYRELHHWIEEQIGQWEVREGDTLVDVGAGTGLHSLYLAQRFPQARVLHIDKDGDMNARAAEKRYRAGIGNHKILELDVEELDFPADSLRGLLSVNALYACRHPQEVLQSMAQWMQAGGYALIVNQGRPVPALEWRLDLAWHLWRRYGWKKARKLLQACPEVSRQQERMRQLQRNGVFWTHDHETFRGAVLRSGFEILESGTILRGCCDWVIAKKKG